MKKIISIIITIISIGFLAGCNMSLTFDTDKPDTPIGEETNTTEPSTPDDGQTGDVVETPPEETEEAPPEPTASKEDLIRQALAEKHEKTIDQVEIRMDQETDDHVRGNVTFLPAGGIGNSGYFLAAKVSGEWEIVIDGQGTISCSLVRSYNFPEDMIADCLED